MSHLNPRFRRINTPPNSATFNVYRVAITGTIEGQMTVNLFYYRDQIAIATGATLAQMQSLYLGVTGFGGIITDYLASLSSDWLATAIIIDSPTSPALARLYMPSILVGTGPAGHLPTTTAAVITKMSGLKGQCGRGHVALPAVPKTWATESTVTNVTAYNALAGQMAQIQANGGVEFHPVIWSKGTRLTPRLGHTDITVCQLRPVLGTVRRRKLGRGK